MGTSNTLKRRNSQTASELEAAAILHGIRANPKRSRMNDHSPPLPTPDTTPPRKIFIEYPPGQRPRRKFSVLNGIINHPDILVKLVQYLPPATIRNLYSISAPFHYQFSSNYQSFILHATRVYAPDAQNIWPWKYYKKLCIADPAERLPAALQPDRTRSLPPPFHLSDPLPTTPHPDITTNPTERPTKLIPSLRYLSMTAYRTLVTAEIPAYLHTAGYPLPLGPATAALKRLWLLLDLPLSSLRIALIQNQAYFSAQHLAVLQHLFIKLDMYFTDALSFTGGEWCTRQLLLAERGLTTLWDWLRWKGRMGAVDALALWVRHCYRVPRRGPFPEAQAVQRDWESGGARCMGTPVELCGRWGNEMRGRGEARLVGVEELVVNEGVRRGLELERELIRMMLWGYTDREGRTVRLPRKEELVPSLRWEESKKRAVVRKETERLAKLGLEAEEVD